MFFQTHDELLILQRRQERHPTIAVERHAIILVEGFGEQTITGVHGQILPSRLEQEDPHQCASHQNKDDLVDDRGELGRLELGQIPEALRLSDPFLDHGPHLVDLSRLSRIAEGQSTGLHPTALLAVRMDVSHDSGIDRHPTPFQISRPFTAGSSGVRVDHLTGFAASLAPGTLLGRMTADCWERS